MCPGAAEYLSDQSEPAIFRVSVSDCRRPGYDPRSRHGVVYGVCNDSTTFCQFLVKVLHGMIVRANVKLLSPGCRDYWSTTFYTKWNFSETGTPSKLVDCYGQKDRSYLSRSNHMYLVHYNGPALQIQFDTVQYTFKVAHTSNISGHITLHAPKGYLIGRKEFTYKVQVPPERTIMTSLDIFEAMCDQQVHLAWREDREILPERKHIFKKLLDVSINLHRTTALQIHFLLYSVSHDTPSCVKLLFSFHPESRVPLKLNSGLYNCTVNHYWRFQLHLHCNTKVECEDGRDESEHCPYSSPACQGWVASYGKCYQRFSFARNRHLEAIDHCKKHGSHLASIKTGEELVDFRKFFQGAFMIGLQSGLYYISFMYRYFYRWSDHTVVYNTNLIGRTSRGKINDRKVAFQYYTFRSATSSNDKFAVLPSSGDVYDVICEKYTKSKGLFKNHSIEFTDAVPFLKTSWQTRQNLTGCPTGHVTHLFLSCDPKSRCGRTCTIVTETGDLTEVFPTTSVTMYSCSTDDTTIPYTLLCDFRLDCRDGSDESFCQHPLCSAFTCSNGQCVSLKQRCNHQIDCLDDSDESNCPLGNIELTELPTQQQQQQQQQLLINLDGHGYFTLQVMNITQPCPDTHYRCRADCIYCLPVYTRCNGYNDCVYHEDERDCETVTCPGLYRCRGSTVCLHADHMCDGWPQCPQRDDEWLCDMTCPVQCLCQGHAFQCPQPFSAHLYPQLRFLDARGSGMTPSDLRNNTYVINLILAHSSISFLSGMVCPNLKYVDLSYNNLTSIVLDVFLTLENLQSLSLRGNPLTSISVTAQHLHQHTLQKLDLSRTHLDTFDSRIVRHFPGLQYVDVSFSSLKSVGPGGFQSVPRLKEVDLRGNMINTFPFGIFRELNELSLVLSPDYRLCCEDVIPNNFPATTCLAPKYLMSSCKNMLQPKTYSFIFWLVTTVASVGNLVCFIGQGHNVMKRIQQEPSVAVFMGCLQSANFCMGIYSAIIAAADEAFRGQYLHHEDRWMNSVACKVAGFLSLLSSEASILTLLLLTLDHLVVVCVPHSTYRFSRRSAAVACGLTWFVGLLLASIPLLPALSHWGNYGQTALCNLMMYDRRRLKKGFGLFHITVIINSFLCIVCSFALVTIYRAAPKQRILVNSDKNPIYASVNLLIKIAIIDSAAWFLITTASVLSLVGVAESEEINIFMAVFVLPLNSAVNPLLSLWEAEAYQWKEKQEKRLLRVLKSRIKSAPEKHPLE